MTAVAERPAAVQAVHALLEQSLRVRHAGCLLPASPLCDPSPLPR